MKILITTPDFSRHGGIRIILEWANRLTQWHEVYLYSIKDQRKPEWFSISEKVELVRYVSDDYDLAILTSPHSDSVRPKLKKTKVVWFLQMAEEMFRNDKVWFNRCVSIYRSPDPIISISEWNAQAMRNYGRTGPIYMVTNGVNFDHFPIERPTKDGRTILIEGFNTTNPAKDPDGHGLYIAKKLKHAGYTILGYSSVPCPDLRAFTKYIQNPSTHQMNELYRKADILVKVTKYDARSCVPVEAMTKGCVTVRGIISGDDDLIHGYNAVRVGYSEPEKVIDHTKRLLTNNFEIHTIRENCYKYVKAVCDWKKIMPEINEIIINIQK